MGVQPRSLGHKIFNRKHIYDMDNELNNRLHDIDAATNNNNYNINSKSNNNSCNNMLFIYNNNNSRILKKQQLQQHQHHHQYNHHQNYYYYSNNYNFNNKNHLTILKILLTTFLIFMLRTTTINCLPVTSKPIENTPEHLAWEAWIMLPPSANLERHRKIMPKSIFVLPTNINNNSKDSNQLPLPQPQIQCPPGHRIDNSKCIPTISINRDQLLIDQLTNLLPVSMKPDDDNIYGDYDYDYSGGNGDTINYDLDMIQSYNQQQQQQQQQLPPLINSNQNTFRDTEKNSEPLKINFSLDKFSIAKDDSSTPSSYNHKLNKNPTNLNIKDNPNDFIMEINNDNNNEEYKLRPFRDQETSSSIIDLSTTTMDDEATTKFQSNSTSTEIDSIETEIETKNENDSKSELQKQHSTTTVIDPNESTTTIATAFTGNTETLFESNDSSTNSNTTEFNKESETESKRESIVTTTISIKNITSDDIQNNDNDNNNDSTTQELLDALELSNSNQNSDVLVTTVPTFDSSTMVSILNSEENEMTEIVESENDFNSKTTSSDYEYDQMTTLNKNYDNSEQNQNPEIATEQMEKEKKLQEKLSEESLVLDKSTEEDSTEPSSDTILSLHDDFTTNLPMYEDFSSELTDQSSSTNYNNIEKSSTEFSTMKKTTTKTIQPEATKSSQKEGSFEHKIVQVNHHRNHHKHHSIPPQSVVRISATQPVEWHEDREPLMESIESNNRFVYHHLGSSTAPQAASTQQWSSTFDKKSPTQTVTSTTAKPISQTQPDLNPDIKEQLRIINMIVEENKRRAQASKVRFPAEDGTPISVTPIVRSKQTQTHVRFPTETHDTSTPDQAATSYYESQNGRFDPEKLIFHRRFFQNQQQQQQQQQHTTTTTQTPTSSISTTTDQHQKPFWWLPSGWEIDDSGDRPLLIRFWSRSPSRNSEQFSTNTESYTDQYRTAASNTHHIVTEDHQLQQHHQQHQQQQQQQNLNINRNSNFKFNTSDGLLHSQQHTTTTSRYRENSRSPTDSLYRDVPSSQNVYKVLNAARQWKYSKR